MQADIKNKFQQAIDTLHREGIDLTVLSEDRDAQHNARVGGAKNSQHTHGTAMDFSVKKLTDAQKKRALEVFRDVGAKGYGIYTRGEISTGSIHIDFREGSSAIWGKNGSYSSASGNWLPEWAQSALSGIKNDRTNASNETNKEQNKEVDPLMAFLVAIIQAIFPQSNETQTADLGNLESQKLPNLKPRQKTLS